MVTPTDPIPVGAHASGYSFDANVFDSNPKYYMYEFVGTYAGSTGAPVTAVGLTGCIRPVIPEVPFGTIVTMFSMIFAMVGFVGFRRYRR